MNWKIVSVYKLKNFNPDGILKTLLWQRGIKTKKQIEEFLNPKMENLTFENVGIDRKEIKKALNLIKKNIKEKKAIVIYGDYDVDGIAGTAILWEVVYKFYKNVHPYIPHRVDEGYGLSEAGIKNLTQKIENCGLIITVDNGIVADSAIEYAKLLGIKVIVTDHHTKGDKKIIPSSLIHTTLLCGASVAYLLSIEIKKEFKLSFSDDHLELAALATVADLVPINKFNRIILKHGLERLKKTKRVGFGSLFKEAGISRDEIGTYHMGYIIAPRLNAAGRIAHAMDSLRLICTIDKRRADTIAKNLSSINKKRQGLTIEATSKASEEIEKNKKLENLIFVQSENYEQGVIGLIASRLVERFYRPTVAVSVGKETSKGSARSILGINIIELIRSCSNFLTEAGGHPMAAGFSIKTKDLPAFKKEIIKKAREINSKLFEKDLKIDLELEFKHISLELYDVIQKLGPFGVGNPTPVFATRKVNVAGLQKVGKNHDHMQILLEKDGYNFRAIIFNHFEKNEIHIGDVIDIAYTIELNEWNGRKKLKLKIKDFISSND